MVNNYMHVALHVDWNQCIHIYLHLLFYKTPDMHSSNSCCLCNVKIKSCFVHIEYKSYLFLRCFIWMLYPCKCFTFGREIDKTSRQTDTRTDWLATHEGERGEGRWRKREKLISFLISFFVIRRQHYRYIHNNKSSQASVTNKSKRIKECFFTRGIEAKKYEEGASAILKITF